MFKLKKRKYTWLDIFYIPFSCAPVSTMGLTMQKLITTLASVFQVVIVARFIDLAGGAVVSGKFEGEVLGCFLALLLIVAWKKVGWRVGNLFANRMATKGNEQFMREYMKKCAKLPYFLLEDPETEDLMSRITWNNRVNANLRYMLMNFANFFVGSIPKIVGILVIIAMEKWWLALVVAAVTVPLCIISLQGGKQLHKAKKEASVSERRHRYFFDILTGREAVEERSLFGYSDELNRQWLSHYDTARKINMKAEAAFTLNAGRGSLLTSIMSSVIILVMIPLAASGQMSIGVFISLSATVYDMVDQMGSGMTRQVAQIARDREYMRELTKFAALPERETDQAQKQPVPEFEELELRDVTFHYPGSDVNILQHFSMRLVKGKHYAIVGENGAGKSTLIKLLTGLYPEYEGEILLNGREMKEFAPESWKDLFSSVFQDFARYHLSVAENIQLGDVKNMDSPGGERKMRRAAEKLCIHGDIAAMQHGYDTKLGKLDDDSVDLSGGQWQKVAMARALMNDAPLLILDEPTAALDPISESLVYEQFGAISKDRTTIFISHRLGSTKLADEIFVIGGGQVKEQGSHEALLAQNGLYSEMFRTQQSWYMEDTH